MRDKMSYNLQEIRIRDKHIALILISIIISGILIRLWYFPYDLPITHDGDNYCSYALDTVILGNLPDNYTLPNNGWPIFLSLFFSIFQFDSALEYMNLQRILSIAVSVATIIPVYFLCRKFFSPLLSIVGSIFFIFSPHIIENSLLGVTEPLFIFLITSSITLFLSNSRRITYYSFWLIALASIVRYEALILFIPFSILFFIKFRNPKENIPKYLFVIFIVVLILLPVAYLRMETISNDGFSNVIRGPQFIIENTEKSFSEFIQSGIINLIKYLGWSSLPYFFLFIPFGIFILFKNRNFEKKTIIIIGLFLLIPAFYAYSRDFQEVKYLYVLYPIFSLISLYLIEFIVKKTKKPRTIGIIIIIGLIAASVLFSSYQLPDYEYEKESLEISYYIYDNTKGVNNYYPETKYLNFVKYDATDNFPRLSSDFISPNIIIIDESSSIDSIIKYVKFTQEKNLTHIVTDGYNAQPKILNDLFFNEDDYPYLEKEFDSMDHGFTYHIKIFRVNFQIIDEYLGK